MILLSPKVKGPTLAALLAKMRRRVIISSFCGGEVGGDVATGFLYNRQHGLLSDLVITGMFFYVPKGVSLCYAFLGNSCGKRSPYFQGCIVVKCKVLIDNLQSILR